MIEMCIIGVRVKVGLDFEIFMLVNLVIFILFYLIGYSIGIIK